MTAAERAELQEELDELKDAKANIRAAMSGQFASPVNGIKKYRYDSGEGSQSAERFSPEELRKQYEYICKRIRAVEDRLGNRSVTHINLKRYPADCRQRIP